MVKVLAAGAQLDVNADASKDELWLSSQALQTLTGWELKAEGLCKDDVCVPLNSELREACVNGQQVNTSGLWTSLKRPVLHDASGSTWMLGEAAAERARKLESLQAPDFTLPDIHGRSHSLSDFRGKKVFLATWASW